MVVNTIEQLKEIGLSEYESRIYTTLLKDSPLTAYEAAKQAGIPTSKVYGVIDKLSEQGILLEIPEGSRKKYSPLDPDEFLEKYRFHMNKVLDTLTKSLKKGDDEGLNYIWNLNDYSSFMEKAEREIAGAEETILISLWPEEQEVVEPFLKDRNEQGVKISTVLFSENSEGTGQIFPHPIKDTLYNEKGGRGFTLVVDGKTAIVGTISKDKNVDGAYSRGPGFVLLAEDYIKHDVYIMKIVQRFDKLLIDTFGPGYIMLRNIFSNEEVRK